jgi:hypothetical protein
MTSSSFTHQLPPACRLCLLPEKDHINENRPEVSKMQGQDALQFSVRMVLAQTEAILKSLSSVVQANGIDALIIDTVQFYAELGAIQLGMPYVQVANGLHWDYSGYTPLCLYGWPHETTPAALARNREGVAKWANLLESASGGHQGTCREHRTRNQLERSLLHCFPVSIYYPSPSRLRL